MVHRLDPAQVQAHPPGRALQFELRETAGKVQAAKDARVAVGDAKTLPLHPLALGLLGFPVLDPVPHREASALHPEHLRAGEPGGRKLGPASIRQVHLDGFALQVHPGDPALGSLVDPEDLRSPGEHQEVTHLVALNLLPLGQREPAGHPDLGLEAPALHPARVDQGFPDPPV